MTGLSCSCNWQVLHTQNQFNPFYFKSNLNSLFENDSDDEKCKKANSVFEILVRVLKEMRVVNKNIVFLNRPEIAFKEDPCLFPLKTKDDIYKNQS